MFILTGRRNRSCTSQKRRFFRLAWMPAHHGRMFYPKLYIPGARFVFTEGPPLLNDISEADVAVVQRMMVDGNIKWIQIARQLGIKVIYDLDDNLWEMPNANPAKQYFEEHSSIKGLEACAEWADVFTVSTRDLQKVVQNKWSKLRNVATGKPIPVLLCENRTPLTLFQKQEGISYEHEGVIVGWSGSSTHAGDLFDIWHVLYKLLVENPTMQLELVGQPPPLYLLRHPRTRMRPWVNVSEYPARFATWNWDIILAPLEKHKFNRSKSSIRMQEAGALHKPCLATDYGPYNDFVYRGETKLQYLLCDNTSHWETKLHELVRTSSLRNELGEAMYANVAKNFRVEQSVPEWQEAIDVAYNC